MIIKHVYEEEIFLNKKELEKEAFNKTSVTEILKIGNKFVAVTPIPAVERRKIPFATIVMLDIETIGISRCRVDNIHEINKSKVDIFIKKKGIQEAIKNIPDTDAFIEKLVNKKRKTKREKILIESITEMKARAIKYFK